MKTQTLTISDAAIKRHAADLAVRQLRDQSIGHLYFRYHQSRETGSWYLVKGRRWIRKGRWPSISATVMRKEAPGLLVNDDVDVKGNQTLADVLTWFRGVMELNRTITDQRRADILSVIDRQLMPCKSVVVQPIQELKKKDLLHGLILPLQQRLAPSTVAKAFRILKQATKAADRVDVIGYDPLRSYRLADFMRETIEPKGAALRASDLPSLAESIQEKGSLKAQVFVWLMLLHGTRFNETRLTAWRWVDLNGGWLEIPGKYTKNRRAHRMPLTDITLNLLRRYREWNPGTHLFQINGSVVSKTHAQRWVRMISDREWSSHDLRKLMRTMLADLGIDWWVAEMMINHAPSKLDRTYIHTQVEQLCRDAFNHYHHYLADRCEDLAKLRTDGGLKKPSEPLIPAGDDTNQNPNSSLKGD
jgi:integrase